METQTIQQNTEIKQEEKGYKKFFRVMHKTSKFLVFFGLLWTGVVLYRLGDKQTSSMVLFLLAIYIIFSRLDAGERKNGQM